MVAGVSRLALISPRDYLCRERDAGRKHEYLSGAVYEMAGASRNHTRLTRNVHGILFRQLGTGPCENLDQDVKVWIEAHLAYFYPDASISCPPNYIDVANGVIDNPTVLFEVLSPSTASIDRGAKFAAYRTLPSLRDYVLIESEARQVEVFSLEGDQWMVRTYTEGTIVLPSISIEIEMEELYRHVTFEATGATGSPP